MNFCLGLIFVTVALFQYAHAYVTMLFFLKHASTSCMNFMRDPGGDFYFDQAMYNNCIFSNTTVSTHHCASALYFSLELRTVVVQSLLNLTS